MFLFLVLFSIGGIVGQETIIGFGSCNNHRHSQTLWDRMGSLYNFNGWVWLGDLVYADESYKNNTWTVLSTLGKYTWNQPRFSFGSAQAFPYLRQPASKEDLVDSYNTLNNDASFNNFFNKIPPEFVTGVWDDHDYGLNNGDREYWHRDYSQQQFLTFLREAAESPRWHRAGVWGDETWTINNITIKFYFLDIRYHSLHLFKTLDTLSVSDLLSSEQKQWFEDSVRTSTADINVVTSGIQMSWPRRRLGETWSNWPQLEEWLFQTLAQASLANVVLLSGDVHYTELSKRTCVAKDTGVKKYFYEITSSGLTHSWATDAARGGPRKIVTYFMELLFWLNPGGVHIDASLEKNFGLLRIAEDGSSFTVETRGFDNTLLVQKKFPLLPITPRQSTSAGSNNWNCDYDVPSWKKVSMEALVDIIMVIPLVLLMWLLYIPTTMMLADMKLMFTDCCWLDNRKRNKTE